MPSKLELVRLKVERADKHIRDLCVALEAFYATNPYGIARKINPDTGEHVYYVTRVDEVPSSISIIAGDALQNLRSALDHLVYQLVAEGIAPKTPGSHIGLPVADSPTKYMSPKFRRKIQGAGPNAIKRIDALKPYRGGNDTLWHLHKLNNVDKHRLLLAAITRHKFRSMTLDDYARMAISNPKIDIRTMMGLVSWTNFGGPTEPLKVGDKLYVKPSYLKLKKNMEFKFEVAFNEPQIIECKSLIETLYEMFKFVENIIGRFADLL
jgi:hypothetical protein